MKYLDVFRDLTVQPASYIVFMPAKHSRLLTLSSPYLYIYRTGYEALYDHEIIISQ